MRCQFVCAAVMLGSSFALAQDSSGILNKVTGRSSVNGSAIGNSPEPVQLQAGEVLQVESGYAEVLLPPISFLRLGPNSEVRWNSSGAATVDLQLTRGAALIEIADLEKGDSITVNGERLSRNGIYRIGANGGSMRTNDGHSLAGDELYRWSRERARRLAEIALNIANRIDVNDAPFRRSGYRFDPGYGEYSWLPGSGIQYDPFGFPFFSPKYIGQAQYVYWPKDTKMMSPFLADPAARSDLAP